MSGWLFYATLAASAGVTQSTLLGRSVGRHPPSHALLLVVRVGVVAIVFLLAAHAGHLAAAFIGWLFGFTAASLWIQRRLG